LESGYFSSWFNSSYGRKAIKRISIEGTRERVSLGEFKDLIIPLPSKDEQKIIGQRINHAQTTIAKEMGYLKKLTTEKSGLMHDLLTGKVRVKLSEASPEMAGG
jgi:type I restriction enzyme S subunit